MNDHSCFSSCWPNSKTKLKWNHLWKQGGPPGVSRALCSVRILCIGRIGSVTSIYLFFIFLLCWVHTPRFSLADMFCEIVDKCPKPKANRSSFTRVTVTQCELSPRHTARFLAVLDKRLALWTIGVISDSPRLFNEANQPKIMLCV